MLAEDDQVRWVGYVGVDEEAGTVPLGKMAEKRKKIKVL